MSDKNFEIKIKKSSENPELSREEKRGLLFQCFDILLFSPKNKKMKNLKRYGKENVSIK